MNKHHHNGKASGAVLTKHLPKGKARGTARRTKETWEEFKERTNKTAEAALDEVTNPQSLRIRAKHIGRRATSFWNSYRYWILGAAATLFLVRQFTGSDED